MSADKRPESRTRDMMIQEIRRIVREYGRTSLSLYCGDYLSIWYDGDLECCMAKWVMYWDVEGVHMDTEIPDGSLARILEDLSR